MNKKLTTHNTQHTTLAGFTLVELLVVIGIIALLATVGGYASLSIIRRTQAARFVSDFRKIEQAWNVWRLDSKQVFPKEDVFYPVPPNPSRGCYQDEPFISETDLITNKSSISQWHGPYLDAIPRTIFNTEYQYDNDEDVYVSGNCATQNHGVNIVVPFCSDNSRVMYLTAIIDKAIDGGDGRCSGRFKWTDETTVPFGMSYSLDTN